MTGGENGEDVPAEGHGPVEREARTRGARDTHGAMTGARRRLAR